MQQQLELAEQAEDLGSQLLKVHGREKQATARCETLNWRFPCRKWKL